MNRTEKTALNAGRVYKKVKDIPPGRVSTYKEIALASGINSPRLAGTILSKNPRMPEIPCHRVVKSNGMAGMYSGKGGTRRKIELLRLEGLSIKKGRIENFKSVLYTFSK
ncbi:MAG: MGMT family protein [Elusimicrobiota bacterium]